LDDEVINIKINKHTEEVREMAKVRTWAKEMPKKRLPDVTRGNIKFCFIGYYQDGSKGWAPVYQPKTMGR